MKSREEEEKVCAAGCDWLEVLSVSAGALLGTENVRDNITAMHKAMRG